jgi:thiosulfate/3-mercaptopyruvate sulfurtransferase
MPTRRATIGTLMLGSLALAACGRASSTVPAAGSVEGYARPELLAETDWLATQLGQPKLRIVDLRSVEAYRQGHIPGAVQLDGSRLKDPDEKLYVTRPDTFARMMGEMGIDDTVTVVAYDDQGGLWAARLWWVLDYYGHTKARVLNGGWKKWEAEKRPVTTEVPSFPRTTFTPKVNPNVICGLEDVKRAIGSPDFAIIDARSAAEYAGTDVRAARGGHVPKAINIDWQRNLTADEPRVWKPAAELRAMYEKAGVTKDKEIITYCQTAVRAAHTLFTLRLIGYGKVRNYDGSWAEWGNDPSTPIER